MSESEALGATGNDPVDEAGDSDEAVEQTKVDERLAFRGVFANMLVRPEIGAIIGAAAIWVFFWAVAGQFGTAGGTSGVLDVAATLGIMAVAVAMLMIGGEFDLSSGAATGALGIVTILLVKDVGELGGAGLSYWVAIPLSFVIALTLGWLNGTIVERTGLPSFIVTLATFFVLRGFKLGFSKLVIDNISVGRADEGAGFDFFQPIFAGVWARNDHQWGARDGVYLIAILLGIAMIAIAIYESNFAHKQEKNPAGMGVLLAGIAGAVVGIILLHTTDGVSANAVAGLVIIASMSVGFFGLATWRYERHASMGSLGDLPANALRNVGLGLVGVAAGIASARIFDVDEQQTILDQLAGFVQFLLVAGTAILVGLVLYRRASTAGPPSDSDEQRSRIFGGVRGAYIAAIIAYGFMFMTTEQGLRAILFVGLALGGLLALAVAANQAGKRSPMARTTVQLVIVAAIAILALFIRSESGHHKFRGELFSVMMFGAGALLAWAIVSGMYRQRRTPDAAASRIAAILGGAGLVSVVVGIIVRLLWTTNEEIERGIAPATFRMSIVWFIGVTAVAMFVLGRTKFGSWIFAVGGNKEAARQIGVPAAKTKTQLFMIVSVAAWLVGLLLAFRLQTLQSGTGNGLEFEYIIAAVVGGTALTGGYGSVLGAAIGAFIMAMSKQGIGLALWNSDWRFAFLGIILLLAVIANDFIKSKAEALR